jgi:hypothetical protein
MSMKRAATPQHSESTQTVAIMSLKTFQETEYSWASQLIVWVRLQGIHIDILTSMTAEQD